MGAYGTTTTTTTTTGGAASGNPFRRIRGQQLPENHSDDALGYRQYVPVLARFTQPDPSGQETNAYTYGRANPISFGHPSSLGACANAAVGVAIVGVSLAIAALLAPEASIAAHVIGSLGGLDGLAALKLAVPAIVPAERGGGCN